MAATAKTFICRNFVTTDPSQNPDPNNPCSGCSFTLTEVEPDIIYHSQYHLIEMHGYQNSPLLQNDIEVMLV